MIATSWQTPAALAIVALTVIIFAWRLLRSNHSKQSPGCGSDCGCSVKPKKP